MFASALAVLFLLPAAASATIKVVNGGFETGNLHGWKTSYSVRTGESTWRGDWSAYSGTTAPISGNQIPAPPKGKYAAIADENASSTLIMYQNIKLKRKEHHVLSLYVYYDAYAPIADPATLNWDTTVDNDQFRIDVMKPKASIDSVSKGILKTVFRTKAGASQTMAPKLIKVNLTKFAGRTIRLRFAVVAGQNYFNAGTDNVKISNKKK